MASPGSFTRPPHRSASSLPTIPQATRENQQLLSRNQASNASASSSNRTARGFVAPKMAPNDEPDLTDDEETEPKALMSPHDKDVDWLPWIINPVRGTERIWIRQKDEAPEWLPLLFDLVVVAVLTVFSLQHSLSTPGDIPTLLSFFVIVFWTWVSQTAFDIRYQANDSLNRFWKFCQIVLFLFQGASSGHWSPGAIRQDVPDPTSSRAIRHEDAFRSFLVVVLAFCVSRALLATQYIVLWIQARKAKRRTRHIILTIAMLFLSAILSLIAVAIPANNRSQHYTKISLFYLGIFLELCETIAQVFLRFVPPVPVRKVAERYGAFALIILGDAIVSISRSFNIAISGLSDTDPNTYFQVFLVILIVFLLWTFLFSHFDKRDRTGAGRAAFWQVVHFPLSFGILLMVGAMVNVVTVVASNQGLDLVSGFLVLIQSAINSGQQLAQADVDRMARYFSRLDLQPPFPQMLELIQSNFDGEGSAISVNIIFLQYAAQIVYSTYSLYNAPITEQASDLFLGILSANSTNPQDSAVEQERGLAVAELYLQMIDELSEASFSGTLWLFPTAGAVLLITSLRTYLWTRSPPLIQRAHHITYWTGGVILLLLTFLNIGNKSIDSAALYAAGENGDNVDLVPFYRLLLRDLPLVIVAVVYLLVWLVRGGFTWWVYRKRVREREREGKGEEGEEMREKGDRTEGGGRCAGEEGDDESDDWQGRVGAAERRDGEASERSEREERKYMTRLPVGIRDTSSRGNSCSRETGNRDNDLVGGEKRDTREREA